MDRRIESIIEAVSDLNSDLPDLDKDEIESRLNDLESDCRNLIDLPWNELPAAIESLADDIRQLYSEI